MKNKLLFAISFVVVCLFCSFSYLHLDIPIAIYFEQTKPLEGFFEIVTNFGKSKWYLISFAAFFLLFRYVFRLKEAANRFLYFFIAVAASGLIVDILKFVFGRARPKLFFEQGIYGIKFFGTEHLYFSMPSGHSATVFSLAVGVLLFYPKFALAAFGAAILVASSRMAVGAHYFSDTVAGAYVGVVFAIWLKTKMIQKGVRF